MNYVLVTLVTALIPLVQNMWQSLCPTVWW